MNEFPPDRVLQNHTYKAAKNSMLGMDLGPQSTQRVIIGYIFPNNYTSEVEKVIAESFGMKHENWFDPYMYDERKAIVNGIISLTHDKTDERKV